MSTPDQHQIDSQKNEPQSLAARFIQGIRGSALARVFTGTLALTAATGCDDKESKDPTEQADDTDGSSGGMETETTGDGEETTEGGTTGNTDTPGTGTSGGSTGTDTGDVTTGDTGDMPPVCPVDTCLNGGDCTMTEQGGEFIAVCSCPTGYAGDSCETCQAGYENQSDDPNTLECVEDKTGPTPVIETNFGQDYAVGESIFTMKGSCEAGCEKEQVAEVYYLAGDTMPSPDLTGEAIGVKDENYEPGNENWEHTFTDLPLDKAIYYSVQMKDKNGNFGPWKSMKVTRIY